MLDKCMFKLLRDFAVEEFFPTSRLTQERKKNLVPTSYLQEEDKICRQVFLSYESLKSRKQRTFYTTSYLQGPWKYRKAKEAIESAKAGLTLLRRV